MHGAQRGGTTPLHEASESVEAPDAPPPQQGVVLQGGRCQHTHHHLASKVAWDQSDKKEPNAL